MHIYIAQHESNTLLIGLTVLVGTTGFVISWFFTAIHYFNGSGWLIVSHLGMMIRERILQTKN